MTDNTNTPGLNEYDNPIVTEKSVEERINESRRRTDSIKGWVKELKELFEAATNENK